MKRSWRRLAGQGGWTLMEVLVVTGMITVLAGIAVPQYAAMAMHMRTGAAASRVLSDLAYARAMSQRTGVHHYLTVDPGSELGYVVQRSANPPVVAPGSDPVVRTIDLEGQMPGVSFDAAGGATGPWGDAITAPVPAGPMVFDPRGLPAAGGAYFVSSEDGGVSYAITVNGAGRIRLWRRRDGGWG